MSEYQYVAFRAVDHPVSAKNLEFMRRQSSRAEITPWSFENEYHYGDFHGNAEEMLRRGYDIHLHYADFGIRKLLLRFPHGLPNARLIKPYIAKDSVKFLKDRTGPGVILAVDPFYEPGDLEDLWNTDSLLERLIPIRGEILDGDPRPCYLAHLAIACDGNHDPEETKEAPVPAGLSALSDAQSALAEFYGLGDHLIAAAAQRSPPMPSRGDLAQEYSDWLQKQPESQKSAWLGALMTDPSSTVRAEMLAKFRVDQCAPAWPFVPPCRTTSELRVAATDLAGAAKREAAKEASRQRAKRLATMGADPASTLRETERLAGERTTQAYRQIGQLLADLREALSTTGQSDMAEIQAQKIKKAYPTRRMLLGELRRHGFVAK